MSGQHGLSVGGWSLSANKVFFCFISVLYGHTVNLYYNNTYERTFSIYCTALILIKSFQSYVPMFHDWPHVT